MNFKFVLYLLTGIIMLLASITVIAIRYNITKNRRSRGVTAISCPEGYVVNLQGICITKKEAEDTSEGGPIDNTKFPDKNGEKSNAQFAWERFGPVISDMLKDPIFWGSVALEQVRDLMIKIMVRGWDRVITRGAVRTAFFFSKVSTSVMLKFLQTFGAKALARYGIKVTEAGAKAIQRISIKAATAAQKEAVKSGAELAVAKVGSKGWWPSPLGAALFIFDIANLILDIIDPAGYSQVNSKDLYKELKDQIDKSFYEGLKDGGIKSLPVYGPADNIYIPEDTSKDSDEWSIKVSENYTKAMNDRTIPEIDEYYTQLNYQIRSGKLKLDDDTSLDKFIDKYLPIDLITDEALKRTCEIDYKAKYIKNKNEPAGVCTWPDKKTCDESLQKLKIDIEHKDGTKEQIFGWDAIKYMDNVEIKEDGFPKIENADTLTYREWNDEKGLCEMALPNMRMLCEDGDKGLQLSGGMDYDEKEKICNIPKDYCLEKGMQMKDGDCYTSSGQNILEMVFGTTLTRGAIQTLSFDQYEDCKPGWTDLGWTCIKTGCESNEDMDGLLCYPKCKSGYRGAGPVCWGVCPKNTTEAGPVCTKKSYGRTALPNATCPKGFGKVPAGAISTCWKWHWYGPEVKGAKLSCPEKDGQKGKLNWTGVCTYPCKDGYSADITGLQCWADCENDTTSDMSLGMCGRKTQGRGVGRVPLSSFYGKKRKIPYSHKD